MSVGGIIIAGTHVEVASVELQPDGDLLVGLITSPPTWVFMRAGGDADQLRATWSGNGRVTIPMPPQDCLTDEKPATNENERLT